MEISTKDSAIIEKILRSNLASGAEVFVFGSRAFGKTKRSSDLDLAIDAGKKLTRKEEQNLFDEFEDSDLPYRVDVVDLNSVKSDFGKIINATKQRFLRV